MTIVNDITDIYFDPLNVLFKLINDKVLDINQKRRTNTKESARRWIFPTVPEEDDTAYPRIALIHGSASFEEFGADRFIGRVLDSSNNTEREVFGNIAKLPITIAVFTRKNQEHDVVFPDNTTRTLKNSAQNAYLLNKIQKVLLENRKSFIDNNMDITIESVESTYDDDDTLWAGNININIELLNTFIKETSDGAIIKTINQIVN